MPIEGTSNEPQTPFSSHSPFPAKGWTDFKKVQEVHRLSQQSPSEIIIGAILEKRGNTTILVTFISHPSLPWLYTCSQTPAAVTHPEAKTAQALSPGSHCSCVSPTQAREEVFCVRRSDYALTAVVSIFIFIFPPQSQKCYSISQTFSYLFNLSAQAQPEVVCHHPISVILYARKSISAPYINIEVLVLWRFMNDFNLNSQSQ